MDNIRNFLQTIGFGKNETEVYLALVVMGTSSVLEISKKTKLHRSNIYDALRKLVQEGLVYEINEPTKVFHARPPKSLVDYLLNRKAELEVIIKDLEIQQLGKKPQEKIAMSKGAFSARDAIFTLLEYNQEIIAYGIPEKAPEVLGPRLNEFHEERVKKKVMMRHIYNFNHTERVKYLNSMKYTEARVLPQKYDSTATTNVCGDKVVIIFWDEELTVLEIKDQSLADSYRNYFEILWRKAKV